MSTYAQLVDDATTTYLDAGKALDGVVTKVLDGVSTIAAKLPTPSVPVLPGLPTAQEVVSAHLDAVDRLVAAQRTFALKVVGAVSAPAVVVPAQATAGKAKAAANA